jgi:hypothetical protein
LQPFNGHFPLWIYFYLRTAIARDEGALQATLAMKSFNNHDTLPRLISLTHDLPSSFALEGYPVHLAESQSARFSLGRFSADG